MKQEAQSTQSRICEAGRYKPVTIRKIFWGGICPPFTATFCPTDGSDHLRNSPASETCTARPRQRNAKTTSPSLSRGPMHGPIDSCGRLVFADNHPRKIYRYKTMANYRFVPCFAADSKTQRQGRYPNTSCQVQSYPLRARVFWQFS